jgi:hypothetical protein
VGPVRRTGNAGTHFIEHKHLFNRCASGASVRTWSHRSAWEELSAQWTGNLKHTNTLSIDAPQAPPTCATGMRSTPLTCALACLTIVYLWRSSSWKSSVEPSFLSFKDQEETWSSIRGGLGLCSTFLRLKINTWWLFSQPFTLSSELSHKNEVNSTLRTKLTSLVQS